ncbi:MAG: hypothetical protein ACOYXO_12465 [Chloroflexota bacterium]
MYDPIVIRLELTIEDIWYILQERQKEIKNRRAFIEYLRKSLPDALDAHLYDEVKYLTNAYIDIEQCPHRHTQTYTTGGYDLIAGQVYDDVREITVCLDCGAQLETETE